MFKTTLISILIVATCHAASNPEILEQWQKFQLQHRKSYKSPVEASRRFQIFVNNLQSIEEHNVKFERGEVTYYRGVNQFSDMTSEEFLEYAHCITPSTKTHERYNTTTLTTPDAIDWRAKDVVTKPQNQGNCGACWAFSTTGAVEAQDALKRGKLSGLSKQNLIDCISTERTQGCEKGDARDAYEYIATKGVEYEVEYPYSGEKGECHQTSYAAKIAAFVKLDENEDAIEEVVGNKGPVSTSISVVDSLKQYSGGIYHDGACDEGPVTHSVLLVGYGTEDGTPYWIVKNSWGPEWGEGGFFRLKKGVNACLLHTEALFPVL